ncbi:MAG: C1 family peptidase [Bacteroidales bacterium]|nr:C1 family peptidase [Bacteroidales bacterium]
MNTNIMKKIFVIAFALLSVGAAAQQNGGISPEMLAEIQKGYEGTTADKAIRNALNNADFNVLAVNSEKAARIDGNFSDRVNTDAVTNQMKSGRCWLFSGLNVLRAAAISRHNLGDFQFSQSYCFFWDQLEKCNLFLQAVIDTRNKPFEDREVDWLFAHPLSDGGTFTGVANLVMKYGVVPSYVMPESRIANGTSQLASQLATILRQDGLRLRENPEGVKAKKLPAYLQEQKVAMLKEIYHVLALAYGVPPTQFEWNGRTYTPVEFYREMVGYDLNNDYVMLMNDPSREYGKVYEIAYDRHLYDGQNWLYVNLPVERIKEMAIASIKGGDAMYFSCDVGKYLDRVRGLADLKNFDYESILGVKYTMDKKQRIMTHASGSSHAMTLVAVDIKDGKTTKWMVENSWGKNTGYNGFLIMTDEWFDEYMFRLVVDRKYVPADVLEMLDQKPVQLPAWDPMFLGEE